MLNGFQSEVFPPLYPASQFKPFLYTAEREEGRRQHAAGAEIGKGNSSKVNETQGFLYFGQTGPFAAC